VESSTDVTLVAPTTKFELGSEIAWKVLLDPASGSEHMRITISDAVTDAEYNSYDFIPNAGSNIFYGKAADLVNAPGKYVMRYYADGVLVGEGRFTVVRGATATPPPADSDDCDPSYPTVCIPSSPPDLDCADVPYRDFEVRGNDPHRFDGDGDGIGCESGGGEHTAPDPTKKPRATQHPRSDCDPSYPTVCIPPYPPDLDCGDIPFRDFAVRGPDRHGFDGDGDGIGCES
jgi:hypothetical protein